MVVLMKKWLLYIGIFFPYAVHALDVPLRLSAVIDPIVTNQEIYVSVDRNLDFNLTWNASDKSFYDVAFRYRIEIEGKPGGTLELEQYKIGLRDISLACTKEGKKPTLYNVIDNTRKNGFIVTADMNRSDSNHSELRANYDYIGQNLPQTTPTVSMVRREYSPYFQKEVAVGNGALTVKFPILTTELGYGGAQCQGGGAVMFFSEL
jgi:hypothetical protein